MKKWYKMSAKNGAAEVHLYDEIGYWGTTAEDFMKELEGLGDVEQINLHINSPGGVITDGFAMYNMLMRLKPATKINTIIDGLAASMASVIAMTGDKVTMPENGFLMIHNPFVFMGGGADDLRHEADLLDSMKKNAIKAYKRKATISDDEIAELMDAETWLDADTALEKGFIDEIEEYAVEEAKFDTKRFNRIPEGACMFFAPKAESDDDAGADGSDGDDGAGETGESEVPPVEEPATDGDEAPEVVEPIEEEQPEGDEEESPGGETEVEVPDPIEDLDTSSNSQEDGNMKVSVREIVNKTVAAQQALQSNIAGCLEMAKGKIEDAAYTSLKSEFDAVKLDVETVEQLEAKSEKLFADAKGKIADAVLAGVAPAVPTGHNVSFGADAQDKFCDVARTSLMAQAGLMKTDEELAKVAEVRKAGLLGLGVQGICRETLQQNGVPHAASMSPNQVYDACVNLRPAMVNSQGTGDFTNVFEDVANKALFNAWTTTPTTYQAWTGRDSIKDFQTKNIVKVTEVGDVLEIKENEAFPFTSTADTKETASLLTVGVAFSLSRKAIIDDQINALTDIPTKLSRSIQRYINRRAYTILYGTNMAGPIMNEDSTAMFTAGHGNFVIDTSGGAPTNATLSDLRRRMMNQTLPSPDGATSQSNSIYSMAEPATILYHSNLDYVIENLIAPAYTMTTSANSAVTREFIRRLTPVSDPVLDELMDAATDAHEGYYLMANPSDIGLITVYNLTGNETPTLRRKPSDVGEALGTAWDIYYDVGVAAVDYRGAAANYGE